MTELRTYDLAPFTRIDFATGIRAVVRRGAVQSVNAETERAGMLDKIEIRLNEGQLRVRRKGGLFDFVFGGGLLNPARLGRDVTFHITVPELAGVSAATGAYIDVEAIAGESFQVSASTSARVTIDSAKAKALKLHVSTGGRLSLGGVCDKAELVFASGGRLSAIELICTDLDLRGSNGATAEVTVFGKVTGALSSGAAVHVIGRPDSVDVKETSGGNLSIG